MDVSRPDNEQRIVLAENKTKKMESDQQNGTNANHTNADVSDTTAVECTVCLEKHQLPVKLPCRHIFCFLCVKGCKNKRCPLCRQQIPEEFFCQPNLIRRDELEQPVTFDDGCSWFYEGVNGWWQYDGRTSKELEQHYKAGNSSCQLLIAGFLYIIDLTNMVQSRQTDRTKRRRIKRDLVNTSARKGIAGLRILGENVILDSDRPGAEGHENSIGSNASGRQSIPIRQADRSGDHQSLSPPTPHNTPQTPMTPSESPPGSGTTERDLSVHLERLQLMEGVPLSTIPLNGSNGSSRGYDTPELLSTSMEDATRLENVCASLQQLQYVEDEQSGALQDSAAEDALGGEDCDTNTDIFHV